MLLFSTGVLEEQWFYFLTWIKDFWHGIWPDTIQYGKPLSESKPSILVCFSTELTACIRLQVLLPIFLFCLVMISIPVRVKHHLRFHFIAELLQPSNTQMVPIPREFNDCTVQDWEGNVCLSAKPANQSTWNDIKWYTHWYEVETHTRERTGWINPLMPGPQCALALSGLAQHMALLSLLWNREKMFLSI